METFHKTRLTLWRNRVIAVGLLLFGLRLVSAAFQEHGEPIITLVLQISASLVFIAAGELSLMLFSAPNLKIDKVGLSESGFLLSSLNWSMTWNDIAYAQLSRELRNRMILIGLLSGQPEHVVFDYERFDIIIERIRDGLRRYGRKIVEEIQAPKAEQP